MLKRGWILTGAILLVVLAAGATAYYAMADDDAQPGLTLGPADRTPSSETPVITNPVVAVIPYHTETKYQPDPFDPDRLRSSRTEVKDLILIHADGTIEHKRAW